MGHKVGDALRAKRPVKGEVFRAAEDLRWLRATALAKVVNRSLHNGILPPRANDAMAMRGYLRDPDSLHGLTASFFDHGYHVQIIAESQLLPEKFSSDDFTERTRLSVVRRNPRTGDLPSTLGTSAAAYLMTDIPPSDPNLSRTAILEYAQSALALQLTRVDSCGELVESYSNADELLGSVAGHGLLTVISSQRSLSVREISCRT